MAFCGDEAMDDVVYAHNVTNERSWKAVLDWEKLHSKTCARLGSQPGLKHRTGTTARRIGIQAELPQVTSYCGIEGVPCIRMRTAPKICDLLQFDVLHMFAFLLFLR